MKGMSIPRRDVLTFLTGALACPLAVHAQDAGSSAAEGADGPDQQLFSGKVLRLGDALRQRKIPFTAEMEDQVVLETPQGALIPILADWRGRAFYQDERLRNRSVDLVGLRRAGIPYLQVLTIFAVDETGRHEYVDYWCDVCAIPMYEIKPCDCCQAEIRLRFTPKDLPADVKPAAP
jgi:hypothetical protein